MTACKVEGMEVVLMDAIDTLKKGKEKVSSFGVGQNPNRLIILHNRTVSF